MASWRNSILRLHRSSQIFTSKKCLHFNYGKLQKVTMTENIKFADSGIVKSPLGDLINSPPVTIYEYIWQNLHKWPDDTAVICGVTRRSYTYSELYKFSKRFGNSLAKKGFKKGDVLAVMLPNIPEYPIILLGALEAGLIVSTVNPAYTATELAHQVKTSGSIVIITTPEMIPKVDNSKLIIEAEERRQYPLTCITVNPTRFHVNLERVIDFQEMISFQQDDHLTLNCDVKIDDLAVLPYSSGTTGLSKGVRLTHFNIFSNLEQYKDPKICHVEENADVIPAILPFYHIYGMVIIMLSGLSRGCKLVTLPKFDPGTFPTIIKDYKATVLYTVPPIVLFLGHDPSVRGEHLNTVKYLISGGAPISSSDAERAIEKSTNRNLKFYHAYGLTETSSVVLCPFLENDNDYSTVGVPLAGTFIKVLAEDGSLTSPGQNGEICIKGPQVMKEYHNNQKATSECMDHEGYFHSGDLGYYNEQGKFYIMDRNKDLIKVKGFQVPPAELEGILRTYPGVIDAAVIGVPDDRTGEKPIAFVVKQNHASTIINIDEEKLLNFVSEKVASFKKLKQIIFVDVIPKSPSGKILKRVLRENLNLNNKK